MSVDFFWISEVELGFIIDFLSSKYDKAMYLYIGTSGF